MDPETVCLVTDGQLPIRQCLFPEAQRKGITLPAYYSKFHDLRKEFSAAYPDSPVSEVEDMLKSKFSFIIIILNWEIYQRKQEVIKKEFFKYGRNIRFCLLQLRGGPDLIMLMILQRLNQSL